MSIYISKPNHHIEEYLDYYFDGKMNFEYAVLLNGAWGSGKTWFVKQYLEKKEDKKICYVSLNGISKTSEIDELIFKSIHPILGSKKAKLVGQILKGTLRATLKFDLDGDGKADGSASSTIPKIDLPDYLKINNNFILVFDDLERCELKKEVVLGYINYFVEQEGIKTLIVSNEEEIKDNDDYARKKEKLIGATFLYTEDLDLAIQSILNEVECGKLKAVLNSNLELIKQIFNQVNYKNLRSFKQTVFAFEHFYKKEYFEYEGDFDSEIFEKILKAFLILSLENKSGRFQNGVLKFKKDDKGDGSHKASLDYFYGFTGTDAHAFYEKYNLPLYQYGFSQNLWHEILDLNIINHQKIKNELYEGYFRFKEEKPIWFKLMDFWDLEDKVFNDLVEQAQKSINNSELDNKTDILHTMSMLIYFEDKNLISFSIDDTFIQKAVSKVKDLYVVSNYVKKIDKYSFIKLNGNYEYFAKDIEKFENFKEKIISSYEDKYKECESERKTKLLNLMSENSSEFCNELEEIYTSYPVLECIQPNDFITRLCVISCKNTTNILNTLKNRYDREFSKHKMYEQEKSWFDDVIKSAENKLETIDLGKIQKFKLQFLILPELKNIKNIISSY